MFSDSAGFGWLTRANCDPMAIAAVYVALNAICGYQLSVISNQ